MHQCQKKEQRSMNRSKNIQVVLKAYTRCNKRTMKNRWGSRSQFMKLQ